uniref:Uncharacterized protein n=1 Tax=uncultured marine virus TaxID=186617 RepID=A0A0F7L9R5_9VIRU|nr:hypothetical protein [uncultured marine virus]
MVAVPLQCFLYRTHQIRAQAEYERKAKELSERSRVKRSSLHQPRPPLPDSLRAHPVSSTDSSVARVRLAQGDGSGVPAVEVCRVL